MSSLAGDNPSLSDLDLLSELFLELLRDLNFAVLGYSVLKLTVHFHLHEIFFVISCTVELEDATVVLGAEVSMPQLVSRADKLILEFKVPVLVLTVELEVLSLGHVVDSHDAVVLLHGVVLKGRRSKRDHLLEMMHLVHVLSLVPDAIGLVNKDKILVLRVDHLAHVVHVHVLKQDEDLNDVDRMGGTGQGPLSTVLNVHVLVVITVTDALESPATTILELLGDLPPVPVLAEPWKTRGAIGSVDLEDVEAGSETKGAESQSLPEAHPLDNAPILIDRLTELEVECGIRLHRWGLNEWLELVTGMGRCSFDAKNALNGLLTQHSETEAGCNVRELLVIAPFNLPFVTSVVIVMASRCPVSKSLLEVDLLGLREPSASGLPPAMVELKVDVVEVTG